MLILNLDIIVHRVEKRQNCVLMTWLHDEKEKWYFYVLCISYDQKCDFPAVVLWKYMFPKEQIHFHVVVTEMICWFWSTPGPMSGRESFWWLLWFQAVPKVGKLNTKLSPCKPLLAPICSPAHWSLIHHSMSMHNQSIFFSITAVECQCCNLFVIRTTQKIHLFLSPSLMNFIEE